MWVFRDGKKSFSTRVLVRELQQLLSEISVSPTQKEVKLDALIRAGELESALSDAGSPAHSELARMTDALASSLLGDHYPLQASIDREALDILPLPASLEISPPEGFAYYALHPLDFAEATAHLANPGAAYAVIGIRNIGTTLAGMSVAALRKSGCSAERITVRPKGHPYDRELHFRPEQGRWIDEQIARSAKFLVVDEGPGLSGSSFLSVGEALLNADVPARQIFFMGTREPDVGHLRTRDAANRWPRFGWHCVESTCSKRFAQDTFVGCGRWRDLLFASPSEWPPCWTQMERAKFLSPDREWLFKFEGLGRFGKKAKERALGIREAGFGCDVYEDYDGFVRYPRLRARPLSARDLCPQVVGRIAAYSAFRAREFRVAPTPAQQLEEMVLANLEKEFGADDAWNGLSFDLPQGRSDSLDILRSNFQTVADGRMQPHEWLKQTDGTILKTDGTSHGDDHFFPGPTDIAWDLAGAAVEWDMDAQATNYLLSEYARLSNDDARPRLPAFLLAYTVFRMGYCKMASEAEGRSTEDVRLRRAYYRYRGKVQELLAAHRQRISLPSSAVVE